MANEIYEGLGLTAVGCPRTSVLEDVISVSAEINRKIFKANKSRGQMQASGRSVFPAFGVERNNC
jgi:hypothetical protein